MKRLCKNITPEKEIQLCKTTKILLLISILILVGIMIYDMIVGNTIDSSRIAILCADVCILCANIANEKNAKSALTAKDNDNN